MRACLLAALLPLSGCAYSEDVARISYTPMQAERVPGAGPLSLDVIDGRTSNRTRISVKLDGYGADAAPIRASRPVTDIVHDALAAEFAQRGFRLVPGGRAVSVTILRFYNSNRAEFPVQAVGDVQLAVSVGNEAGTLYRRTFNGSSSSADLLTNGSNAAESVSRALQDAVAQMFSDGAFIATLTAPSAGN